MSATRSRRMHAAAYFSLVGSISLLASSAYRDYFEKLVGLALTEEHSYLVVAFFSIFTVLYLALRTRELSFEVRAGKALAFATLSTAAALFYALSRVDLGNYLTYQGLSFALAAMGLVILAFSMKSARGVVTLLSLLLLAPVPTGVFDSLTPGLSKAVGRLAAAATGSEYVEVPGGARLLVQAGGSRVELVVEQACTGIVTLSSVLAAVPVLAYVIEFSPAPRSRRLAALGASAAAALAIGFAGNLVRVLLVIAGVMALGPEAGMGLFHYSPSAAYSALSVLAAFLIASRVAGVGRPALPAVSPAEVGLERGTALSVITLLAAASLSALVPLASVPGGLKPARELPPDFLAYPEDYLFPGFRILGAFDNQFLAGVLGALSVRQVQMALGNETYSAFVEIVDNPGRLHTWQYCLQVQGYDVTGSWSADLNGTRAVFVEVRRGNSSSTLGYALFPADVQGRELYVRVSAMVWGSGPSAVDAVWRALEAALSSAAPAGPANYSVMAALSSALLAELAAAAFYTLTVLASSAFNRLRRSRAA